jgi:Leucine-rich repeat (LRR) protein
MENTTFDNLLSLLEHKDTFQEGLVLAQQHQEAFEKHFGCGIADYKELMTTISDYTSEYFRKPLKEIERLELSNKFVYLYALPANIGLLVNLKHLCLSYNQLTTFPKQILELKNLDHLDLTENEFTNLPAAISELKKLRKLYLGYNKFAILPKEIGELKNLLSLFLYNNQLTTLPAEIGGLKELKDFDLSTNQLTTLPKEIGELEQLETLNLSDNPLTDLPNELRNLKNCKICIGKNPTDELRKYVKGWKNIVFRDNDF